jgi:asparagine synthase (glutamine-hydrolysing)
MCGIVGMFGPGWGRRQLETMTAAQRHRGPDDTGIYVDLTGLAGLGHNRLSIIDLSAAGHQPMFTPDGSRCIVFNGEIYNYLELREELREYNFRSHSDTEVILAAYERWGETCLDHFFGMFAFLIWDSRTGSLFAARDRFGVKPLYYAPRPDGGVWIASEIQALHAAGIPAHHDETTWATYLAYGLHDHSDGTFWNGIKNLPPGYLLTWQRGRTETRCWYDLAQHSGVEFDSRPVDTIREEYAALLADSVRLRFRSDVEVGINISGGLDSSTLLGLVHATCDKPSSVKAFTYATGDARYDETPWVGRMLAGKEHPSFVYEMHPAEIPELAASVQTFESEPFGGFPTLAYARLFEQARSAGVIVLLDGQGMDEQWAGYDYYEKIATGRETPLQGTTHRALAPECLTPEFLRLAIPFEPQLPFPDPLRNRQYLDARYTKIPRALRFNDRVSMRSSTELREPFMDHRLFELALRQPPERKIVPGVRKWMLRDITRKLLPSEVVEAPKRPVQTPQREWLAGPLREWANGCIESALNEFGGSWFQSDVLRRNWRCWTEENNSNSFFVWQWISVGLAIENCTEKIMAIA